MSFPSTITISSTNSTSHILDTARHLEGQLKLYEDEIRNSRVLRNAGRAREKELEKEVLALRAVLKQEEATTRKLTKRCTKLKISVDFSGYTPPTVAEFQLWPEPLPEFPSFPDSPATTPAAPPYSRQPSIDFAPASPSPATPHYYYDSYTPAYPTLCTPILEPAPRYDQTYNASPNSHRNVLGSLPVLNPQENNRKRRLNHGSENSSEPKQQQQPRKKVKFNADGIQIGDSVKENGNPLSRRDVVWRTEPART